MTVALLLPRAASRVPAWHAPDDRFFHDNAECVYADVTPLRERLPGEGGRAPCTACARLHRFGFEQELESVLPLL